MRRISTSVYTKRELSRAAAETNPRVSPGCTVQERVARAIAQRRQMERLAMLPENNLMVSYNARRPRAVFVCSDGARIPYEVLGDPSLDVRSFSFVVVHDIFDTLDSTKIFFRRLAQRHAGCQVLVYNYAGQAGSSFAASKDLARGIDAMTHARHLNELMKHVDSRGDMLLGQSPFLLVGIGFGFQICAQLATMYFGDNDRLRVQDSIRGRLRGLVSINGFVHVDSQLAAALRAALSAFKTFPTDRPDLPVSYLSRFLFSDDYLATVHPRLALNIYTAVANPISLDGRIALIRGLLNDAAASKLPSNIPVPLVILQSTQDALVSPSQVDSLLGAHHVRHLWSHELEAKDGVISSSALGARGQALIRETVWSRLNVAPNLACVVWVKAGHEVRQEAPKVVDGLFEAIVPYAEFDGIDDTYVPEVSPAAARHLEHFSSSSSRNNSPSARAVAPETANIPSSAPLAPLVPSQNRGALPIDNDNYKVEEECGSPVAAGNDDDASASSNLDEDRPPSAKHNHEEIEEGPIDIDSAHNSSMPTFTGTVSLSLSLSRMIPDDFTETVRAALINDVASVLTKLGGIAIAAGDVQIQAVKSGTMKLKVSGGMSPDEAKVLGTVVHTKLRQPLLPAYWADHEVASVSARREVRMNWVKKPSKAASASAERQDRDAEDAFSQAAVVGIEASPSKGAETEQPPVESSSDDIVSSSSSSSSAATRVAVLSDETQLVATAEQRKARRYAERVAPAHVAVLSQNELDKKAVDQQQLAETDESKPDTNAGNERVQLQYGEMQRQADVDEANLRVVEAGIVSDYEPPKGEAGPVIRPSPVEYKEGVVPSSILRRNDPSRVLASPTLGPSSSRQPTVEKDESQSIKREMASPQLKVVPSEEGQKKAEKLFESEEEKTRVAKRPDGHKESKRGRRAKKGARRFVAPVKASSSSKAAAAAAAKAASKEAENREPTLSPPAHARAGSFVTPRQASEPKKKAAPPRTWSSTTERRRRDAVLSNLDSSVVRSVTSTNADRVRFDATTGLPFDVVEAAAGFSSTVLTVDYAASHLINLRKLDPSLVRKTTEGRADDAAWRAWVRNHYRWIVWKLAAIERVFGGGHRLTYDAVVEQIARRFEREIERAQKPALRAILQRDAPAQRLVVLCVSEVGETHLELTDGWYSVRAALDRALSFRVARGAIRVGTKLAVCEARLEGPAADPLDALVERETMKGGPSAVQVLHVHANGTRRARRDARLGFQRRRRMTLPLGAIGAAQGVVPALEAVVARVVLPVEGEEDAPCLRLVAPAEPRPVAAELSVRQSGGDDDGAPREGDLVRVFACEPRRTKPDGTLVLCLNQRSRVARLGPAPRTLAAAARYEPRALFGCARVAALLRDRRDAIVDVAGVVVDVADALCVADASPYVLVLRLPSDDDTPAVRRARALRAGEVVAVLNVVASRAPRPDVLICEWTPQARVCATAARLESAASSRLRDDFESLERWARGKGPANALAEARRQLSDFFAASAVETPQQNNPPEDEPPRGLETSLQAALDNRRDDGATLAELRIELGCATPRAADALDVLVEKLQADGLIYLDADRVRLL
ncbi:hypothetical protein CTAYLR_007016 [Chrysophaeum taylorii]|uniref:Uncharacterized protein n=1 Tax=Chrysophaeum taylorii TaxID=2483200 RepID=A0AAD7U9A5_9STRA|nr:hypothetical protein CTAYLR_007016 [Chrysophaeum taylorii]